MREIKFRAWHKKRKRWYHVFHWHKGDTVDTITILPSFNGDETLFVGEDVDLMQFTGLKDKNGMEIWERDIVKFPNPNPVNQYICEVEWRPLGGYDPFHSIGYHPTNWEVIGNIYENPELLQEKL